jgi:uncharacterized protein (TIGR02266 family)
MASSTGSGSTGGRGPRSSRPDSTSKSPEPSGDRARQAFEPRRDLAVPIAVELRRRGGTLGIEYAVNLSPGGLCLHLPSPLAVGEAVELAFELPGGERIEARGRVIWSDASQPASGRERFSETGVRFEGLSDADRRRIVQFVGRG